MNSQERVLTALNHQRPDRPPRDLGSTTATGIHPLAYQALKKHLGLDDGFEYLSSRALLARVEQPVIDHLGIDLLPIISSASAEVPELDENRTYVDRWGVERRLPEGNGHYLVSSPPLAGMSTTTELAEHSWPEPREDFSELTQQARQLRETTDKALVLNLEVGFLHQAQFMRGFDHWLMDLAGDPTFAENYMDRILEIWLAEAEAMVEAVNGLADVVIYADDIAFQNGTMVSADMYQRYFKPRQKKVFDLMTGSRMKSLYHSCGSLGSLLGELVDMGIDALNPVQVSAKGMDDTRALKEQWGEEITFWGGVDTHYVLPRGTVEEVEAEVRRRLNDLAVDGGYVLASVHDIQPEVPPQNILAMFRAADNWSDEQQKEELER
ncbi:MAG: uroporphyrinogen decarboxylase family protein [Anaerolineales bacterium]|nr:uroporphyrinogen decarboxylase family protein [Anaerolineales bacterium]